MNKYRLKDKRFIGSDILLLTLQPKRQREAFDFYAGQYAAIGFWRNGRPSPVRCFSIVNSPNNTGILQFAIRVQGDFTRSLTELEPGDSMFVQGPYGNFVMDERYDRNVVLLAAGIGITPFMSMIRYASDARLRIPVTLLYSIQSQHDVPFAEELMEHERRNPNFKVAFFVTGTTTERLRRAGARVLAGRIDENRLDELTSNKYERFTFFICGPKKFIAGMKSTLRDNNANPDKIISEEFMPVNQVSDGTMTPTYGVSKWTFGLTALSLVVSTGFFMTLDLARAVPRIAHAQSLQQTQTANSGSQQSTPSGAASSTTPTATPGTVSNPIQTQTSPTPTPTYTQPQQSYYQPPVTSIS